MKRKTCKICGQSKPLDSFYAHSGCRDGVRPECKACNLALKALRHAANPQPARDRTSRWREENPDRYRENQVRFIASGGKKESDRRSYLKRKYGITLEQYDEMLQAQDGRCAICGREPRSDISLHVDHHHESGRLRGLLCFSCNVTVGHLREEHDRLRAIADYLDAHDPDVQELAALTRERLGDLKRPAA